MSVDLGMIANERKKAQNGADAGALAGGRQELIDASDDAIVDEVVAVTHLNMGGSTTLAEWRARFQSDCTDSDRNAAEFPVVSTLSACISFNTYRTRVRVRIPDTHANTAFAGVIGISELKTHGAAEAEVVPGGSGGLLPFGLVGDPGVGEYCLKTGQPSDPPNIGVCSRPASGNFGWLDISWYGNPLLGTPQECTGQTVRRMEVNLARGADHPLDEYRGPDEVPAEPSEALRNDRALCPDLGARPNEALDQDGANSATLNDGLIAGTDIEGRPVPGRLTLGPYTQTGIRGGSLKLDNKPLWAFIDPTLTASTIPASCVAGTITKKAQMITCLQDYQTGGYTIPLFSRDADANGVPDILASPRLGMVPEFYETAFSSSEQHKYTIERFRLAFVQTTYFKCNSGGCDAVFEPGENGTSSCNSVPSGSPCGLPVASNKNTEALSALLVPEKTMPTSVLAVIGPHATIPETVILRR
jgi:hypothetical protein